MNAHNITLSVGYAIVEYLKKLHDVSPLLDFGIFRLSNQAVAAGQDSADPVATENLPALT